MTALTAAATRSRSFDAEALAAAAHRVDVRVLELERLLQAFPHEIERRAVQEIEALRVDDHLGAVRFEQLVAGADFVRVVVGVGEARAADFLHADAQAEAPPALRELRLDLFCRTFRQLYRHGLLPSLAIRPPSRSGLSAVSPAPATAPARNPPRPAAVFAAPEAEAHRAARELGLHAHREQRRAKARCSRSSTPRPRATA